jgi:hypothetical protein
MLGQWIMMRAVALISSLFLYFLLPYPFGLLGESTLFATLVPFSEAGNNAQRGDAVFKCIAFVGAWSASWWLTFIVALIDGVYSRSSLWCYARRTHGRQSVRLHFLMSSILGRREWSFSSLDSRNICLADHAVIASPGWSITVVSFLLTVLAAIEKALDAY